MIAALVFGFVIGFSISTGSISIDRKQANLQDFLHYEGNVQWAKE
jgi:hypothetical protein